MGFEQLTEIDSLLDEAICELEQIETYGEDSHVKKALKKLYEIKKFYKTDEEHVKELQAKGFTVICGGQKTVEGLASIHDMKGLSHMGFGYFVNDSFFFDRADSPKGTRFYTQRPRN